MFCRGEDRTDVHLGAAAKYVPKMHAVVLAAVSRLGQERLSCVTTNGKIGQTDEIEPKQLIRGPAPTGFRISFASRGRGRCLHHGDDVNGKRTDFVAKFREHRDRKRPGGGFDYPIALARERIGEVLETGNPSAI